MQQNLIEHAAQHIAIALVRGCIFYCFGNCRAQRAGAARETLVNLTAYLCGHGRRRDNICTIGVNDFLAVRLLLIRALYHVNLAVQVKILASHCQRSSPLTCTGLRRHTLETLRLGIICLCNGGIELVAAARVAALKFVINLCRRIQCFFQIICTHQRRRTEHPIVLAHFFRNVNIAVGLVEFLLCQLGAEHRLQICQLYRLVCCRIEHRAMLCFHIRANIVPLLRDLIFAKINFIWNLCHNYCLPIFKSSYRCSNCSVKLL